jgi:DNA repair exonuclease SbcCD ATPase subunit
MSDSNKYINTYIDYALGTVHDYLNQVLQLKTQLKISNDLVAEKDQVISSFEQEKQQHNNDMSLLDQANQNAKRWEDEVNAMRNKVAHMETLTSQYNQIKQEVIKRDHEITRLSEALKKVEDYDSIKKKLDKFLKQDQKNEKKVAVVAPKNDINKQNTKPLSVSNTISDNVKDTKIEIETDDF